ncbi:SapC family protein [Alteromonas sp. 1_MG-2023]|uniref:SapC family protein n=1 Tax=Alteromonas sp. 1_MG-2023 TaxID=3062669 RepID=UPI0026E31618|nr:SapC family protein [Alteromonas sp. 1_MG-2023]MDO6568515.1 SapC family protein [Alteromonas sp. 1_MG-2023]
MANHALLNNNEHKDLAVIQGFGAEFGHDQMCVPVYPAEVRHAQAHYPIVFAKDANGDFQMVALLGVEQGENLFVDAGQWRTSYKPLVIEKGPFLIGRNTPVKGQEDVLSIFVDLDDPRVLNTKSDSASQVKENATAVFLPHGGNTDYIDNIANVLSTIHAGHEAHKNFVDACNALGLIESFVIDMELGSTGTHRLSGFYTINEEKLNALDGSEIIKLHESGHLQTIYMMLASMSQLRQVIAYKKAALGQA